MVCAQLSFPSVSKLHLEIEIDGKPTTVFFNVSKSLYEQAFKCLIKLNIIQQDDNDSTTCSSDVSSSSTCSYVNQIVDKMEEVVNNHTVAILEAVTDVEDRSLFEAFNYANTILNEILLVYNSPHIKSLPTEFSKEFYPALQNNIAFIFNQINHFSTENANFFFSEMEKNNKINNIFAHDDVLDNKLVYEAVQTSSFEFFESQKYDKLMVELSQHAKKIKSSFNPNVDVEGGLWLSHSHGNKMDHQAAIRKRECLLLELDNKHPKRIGEVGFNAGHTSGMYLSVLPNVTVSAFDICRHDYTVPAAELLKTKFGESRLELICGDSKTSLRTYKNIEKFEFFFVDGNHAFEFAYSDIVNACSLSVKGGTIVVDDCNSKAVRLAFLQAVEDRIVAPLHDGLCWAGERVKRTSLEEDEHTSHN